MLDQLKQRYWNHIQQGELLRWSRGLPASSGDFKHTAAFVAEEFFHLDLRGFGGFGRVIKTVTEHYNTQAGSAVRFAMAFATATPLVKRAELRQYHHTPVALRPTAGDFLENIQQYRQLLTGLAPRVFICIDWYPSYLNTLLAMPDTPALIWIRDPRNAAEWRRIAAVPGEHAFEGKPPGARLTDQVREKHTAMRILLKEASASGRKVVFCAKSPSVIEAARSTYGLPDLQAHLLPTPLPSAEPQDDPELALSVRPSLLFLGRLDPVKRPWIAFDIAARHPEIDVIIAGHVHQPAAMAPWLERYAGLPNLQLLGHVDGEAKERLLRQCWALINTSVHEAEPISFLEAFSHGKPVIGGHAAEDVLLNYGYYTGPVEGEGLDAAARAAFDGAIASLLDDPAQRRRKGEAARAFIRARHTHDAFLAALQEVFAKEGIPWR